MKTKILILLAMAGLLILLTGCSGLYGNQKQYDKGDWYGLADSREVARTKADKLALVKLQAAPVQTLITNGVPQGYRGIVANLSQYNRYNFKLSGPENKSFLLGPGERAIDYLIPGSYACVVFQGGGEIGRWTFRVGVQQSTFLNETYHWYVYTDR